MNELGRLLFFAGLAMAGIGLLLWLGGRMPPGRMPGDIVIQRENFSFHFPLTTCLLVSAVLTLLFWLFRR
jgi:uncharacterized protein HemY